MAHRSLLHTVREYLSVCTLCIVKSLTVIFVSLRAQCIFALSRREKMSPFQLPTFGLFLFLFIKRCLPSHRDEMRGIQPGGQASKDVIAYISI